MIDLAKVLYKPRKNSHKGQNGQLLVIGGSKKYHGAPMFSILAARRFIDLIYFYPGEEDINLIRAIKTIPEVIVVNNLDLLEKVDCILFGIGFGKSRFNVKKLLKIRKLVVDGDGFKLIKDKLEIFAKNNVDLIITPHEREFQFLFSSKGTVENVVKYAKKFSITILKKDPRGDIVSNGRETYINKIHNPGMTKGGTGDVLAGLTAALFCKNSAFLSAKAAANICGKAGNSLKRRFGFNFSASDLANELAKIR